MSLEKITKLRDQLHQTIREEGKSAICTEFKALFDAMPRLSAVQWRQYTDYFNDGEACNFHVHEPYFAVDNMEKADGEVWDADYGEDDDGNRFCELYSFKRGESEQPEAYNYPTVSDIDIMQRIEAVVQGEDDIMRAIFGDHVQVTVYREGKVVIEEFSDHD